jgi:hypothetical protein
MLPPQSPSGLSRERALAILGELVRVLQECLAEEARRPVMTGEKSLVNGGIRNGKQWSIRVNERMRVSVDLGGRRVGSDTTAPYHQSCWLIEGTSERPTSLASTRRC